MYCKTMGTFILKIYTQSELFIQSMCMYMYSHFQFSGGSYCDCYATYYFKQFFANGLYTLLSLKFVRYLVSSFRVGEPLSVQIIPHNKICKDWSSVCFFVIPSETLYVILNEQQNIEFHYITKLTGCQTYNTICGIKSSLV